jgi:hypothetical protein
VWPQPFAEVFPRADMHELVAPDMLHQMIKGTFKDNLVTWIESYLYHTHGKQQGKVIMDIIDRRLVLTSPIEPSWYYHRIAIVPAFVNLRRFPQGRDFKQWTGDDSKALMKVLPP